MSKADDLRRMREENASGKAPDRLKPSVSPIPKTRAQPQKRTVEREKPRTGHFRGKYRPSPSDLASALADPVLVTKAVTAFLAHRMRMAAGMKKKRRNPT